VNRSARRSERSASVAYGRDDLAKRLPLPDSRRGSPILLRPRTKRAGTHFRGRRCAPPLMPIFLAATRPLVASRTKIKPRQNRRWTRRSPCLRVYCSFPRRVGRCVILRGYGGAGVREERLSPSVDRDALAFALPACRPIPTSKRENPAMSPERPRSGENRVAGSRAVRWSSGTTVWRRTAAPIQVLFLPRRRTAARRLMNRSMVPRRPNGPRARPGSSRK